MSNLSTSDSNALAYLYQFLEFGLPALVTFIPSLVIFYKVYGDISRVPAWVAMWFWGPFKTDQRFNGCQVFFTALIYLLFITPFVFVLTWVITASIVSTVALGMATLFLAIFVILICLATIRWVRIGFQASRGVLILYGLSYLSLWVYAIVEVILLYPFTYFGLSSVFVGLSYIPFVLAMLLITDGVMIDYGKIVQNNAAAVSQVLSGTASWDTIALLPLKTRRILAGVFYAISICTLIVYGALVNSLASDKSGLGWATLVYILILDALIFGYWYSGALTQPALIALMSAVTRALLFAFGNDYWMLGHSSAYFVFAISLAIRIILDFFPTIDPTTDKRNLLRTTTGEGDPVDALLLMQGLESPSKTPSQAFVEPETKNEKWVRCTQVFQKYGVVILLLISSLAFAIELIVVSQVFTLTVVTVGTQLSQTQATIGAFAVCLVLNFLMCSIAIQLLRQDNWAFNRKVALMMLVSWVTVTGSGIYLFFVGSSYIMLAVGLFFCPALYSFLLFYKLWVSHDFHFFQQNADTAQVVVTCRGRFKWSREDFYIVLCSLVFFLCLIAVGIMLQYTASSSHIGWTIDVAIFLPVSTFLILKNWFNTFEADPLLIFNVISSIVVLIVYCVVMFVVVLSSSVSIGSVGIIALLVGYPAIVWLILAFIKWRDDRWKMSTFVLLSFVVGTCLYLGLSIALAVVASLIVGLCMILLGVIVVLVVATLKVWKDNKFYIPKSFYWLPVAVAVLFLSMGIVVGVIISNGFIGFSIGYDVDHGVVKPSNVAPLGFILCLFMVFLWSVIAVFLLTPGSIGVSVTSLSLILLVVIAVFIIQQPMKQLNAVLKFVTPGVVEEAKKQAFEVCYASDVALESQEEKHNADSTVHHESVATSPRSEGSEDVKVEITEESLNKAEAENLHKLDEVATKTAIWCLNGSYATNFTSENSARRQALREQYEMEAHAHRFWKDRIRYGATVQLLILIGARAKLTREKSLFAQFIRQKLPGLTSEKIMGWGDEEKKKYVELREEFLRERDAYEKEQEEKRNLERQAEKERQRMAKEREAAEAAKRRKIAEDRVRRDLKAENRQVSDEEFEKLVTDVLRDMLSDVWKVHGQTLEDIMDQTTDQFVDKEFPASEKALYHSETDRKINFQVAQWKRPVDYLATVKQAAESTESTSSSAADATAATSSTTAAGPALFCGDSSNNDAVIEPGDIVQGALGDCWFLSALAVVAKNPERITALFHPDIENGMKKGVLMVKFYKNGTWQAVAIDDLIPMFAGGKPAFSRSRSPNELWVMMLEKAYAKLHQSYDNLTGGLCHMALVDLTGGIAEELTLDGKAKQNPEAVWQKLKKYNELGFLMGAGSHAGADASEQDTASDTGIVRGHAYSLLDVIEVDDVRLLKLRNPWGEVEWNGDWSDDSDMWTRRMKMKADFTEAKNDGIFHMELADFMEEFRAVYICKLMDPSIFKHVVFNDEWKGDTAGGAPNPKAPNAAKNPQFSLKVDRPTRVIVVLQQEDPRVLGRDAYHIGVLICKKQGKRVSGVKSAELVGSSLPFINRREVSIDLSLSPNSDGTPYTIFPSTFQPGYEAKFKLTVWSDSEVTVSKLDPEKVEAV